MKRMIFLCGLFPVAAWAHPGHHDFDSLLAALTHLLSEPDHMAMMVAAGLGWVWLRRVLIQRRR